MLDDRIHAEYRRAPRRLPALTLALLGALPLGLAAAASAAEHSSVFDTNCSMCHQLAAAGVPGQFPRLAGRAGKIAATDAGRNYLERVVLFGMIGGITVDGTPIVGGVMPSFSSLSNEDLAAALDYIISLDSTGKSQWKGEVIKPADIAAAREGKTLSPGEVHQLRATALGGNPP
jgi:cytochrome c5